MRHVILDNINTYEIALILRNRFKGYIHIGKESLTTKDGVFKNEFIDVIKPNKNILGIRNQCDASKEILKDERYELQTLEEEYQIQSKEPDKFHGLEPFELAEFRIVHSVTYEALDIKMKEMQSKL